MNVISEGEISIEKMLDILQKQHESFKIQTGLLIDILYLQKNQNSELKNIKLNLNNIYILSCNIAKILNETKNLSLLNKTKTKQNPRFIYNLVLSEKIEKNKKSNFELKMKKEVENEQDLKKNVLETKNIEECIRNNQKNLIAKKKFNSFSKIDEEERLKRKTENLGENKSIKEKYDTIKKNKKKDDYEMEEIFSMKLKENDYYENFENDCFDDKKKVSFEEVFKDSFINFSKQNSLSNIKFELDDKNSLDISVLMKESLLKDNSKNFLKKEKFEDRNESKNFEENEENFFDDNFSSKYDDKKKFDYDDSKMASRIKKIKKRGKYNILPLQYKKEAIRIARMTSIKSASDTLKIPEKNIKRWMKNGPERKPGAGRKMMDPKMEENLKIWIKNKLDSCGSFPDPLEIKKKAKEFTTVNKFKASKGWCDKFLRRNYWYFKDTKDDHLI
jgi:hypothetical protein